VESDEAFDKTETKDPWGSLPIDAADPQAEPEYRIYVDSRDGVPVVRDVCGEEKLALALAVVRAWFPNDHVYVREIMETVRHVYPPIFPRK